MRNLTRLQVFTKPDGIYRFRLINISMQVVVTIYDDNGQACLVNPNSASPLLNMESHVHPLHVIINAHSKFVTWLPRPMDGPTLEIIDNINEIWEVWNSIRPAPQYLSQGSKDQADLSSLGSPSEPGTRSHSGKQSDQNSDGESSIESRTSKGKQHSGSAGGGGMLESGILTDATPSLDLSTSDEPHDNLSDLEYPGDVHAWCDTVQMFSPPEFNECDEANAAIGSPRVTEYKGWEPRWDRRWVNTSSFSSNDWAYYCQSCNLTDRTSSRLLNTS